MRPLGTTSLYSPLPGRPDHQRAETLPRTMSCPNCVSGTIHHGTPKGAEVIVGGFNAYAVGDENSDRIIVIGVDIFGWKFVNTRLLADEYASHGFRVVIPDLFNGYELPQWTLAARDPVYPRTLFQRYIALPASLFVLAPFVLRNAPRQASTLATVASALRAARPSAKVGFVGFCWGGRFAISENHQFDATVACHPSLVKFPQELDGVRKPFSLAVAATDHDFDRARAEETERILKERGLADVQVVVYEGVEHGWTIRGDMSNPTQKKARDQAVQQVVGWFEKHLKT
ncbi:alpha/beta-hydrolase [Earliella scabrosa]|nr:alpha/beta-hydrolase [Earliella scabrosa]